MLPLSVPIFKQLERCTQRTGHALQALRRGFRRDSAEYDAVLPSALASVKKHDRIGG
jgi:hypothetical protein